MQRPLLLTGFMATGKSTVARLCGERLGVPVFDLDTRIEERAGTSVARVFAERGERAFRALEREELFSLLAEIGERRAVVALGGGALLDRETRVLAASQSVAVCLTAEPEEVLRRALLGSVETRPLLVGADPEARIRLLLAERALAYRESHAQVATDGRTAAEVASAVVDAYERGGVLVLSGESSYVVDIGAGVIERRLTTAVGKPTGLLLVTDRTVGALYGERVKRQLAPASTSTKTAEAMLEPGEEHKNLTGLSVIFESAYGASLDRQATFVGLGGGVVTDMTGFAAATWVRGVRWGGVPTTLLAMVDASVGGKTAVDFHAAKNSVGAFWQPSFVLCDTTVLASESERMFRGALSEVIKTALIGDAELLTLVEERTDALLARDAEVLREVVERSVRVKARVVSLDEREQGIRATLNLGHTIGHALEAAGGYTALTHGEAVSLGLVAACRFGEQEGRTPAALTRRVTALLSRLGLPHRLEADALRASAAYLGHDKKRAGASVRFVFARDVGRVDTDLVSLERVLARLESLAD